MIDVVMPQLGESVTEGTIVAWYKSVGEEISVDEFLCDVSTDKVTFEVPSPSAGILSEILTSADQVVAVGTVIARISAAGAVADAMQTASPDTLTTSPAEISPASTPSTDEIPRPSPLARRLARENGIDLTALKGSGAHGRVRGEDVRKAIAHQKTEEVPPPSRTPEMRPSSALAPGSDGDTVIPFTLARKQIAEHMVRSVYTSPHGYIAFEIDYGTIEDARSQVLALKTI